MYGFRNTLKCSKGNSEGSDHRRLKFLLADFCWSNSLDFQTECSFLKNGQRADVVVEDWKLCFEVVNSEKSKDSDRKVYPLQVINVPVSISPIDLEKMLIELRDTEGSAYEFYQKKYGGKQVG